MKKKLNLKTPMETVNKIDPILLGIGIAIIGITLYLGYKKYGSTHLARVIEFPKRPNVESRNTGDDSGGAGKS